MKGEFCVQGSVTWSWGALSFYTLARLILHMWKCKITGHKNVCILKTMSNPGSVHVSRIITSGSTDSASGSHLNYIMNQYIFCTSLTEYRCSKVDKNYE